jgi:hypothetical protein
VKCARTAGHKTIASAPAARCAPKPSQSAGSSKATGGRCLVGPAGAHMPGSRGSCPEAGAQGPARAPRPRAPMLPAAFYPLASARQPLPISFPSLGASIGAAARARAAPTAAHTAPNNSHPPPPPRPNPNGLCGHVEMGGRARSPRGEDRWTSSRAVCGRLTNGAGPPRSAGRACGGWRRARYGGRGPLVVCRPMQHQHSRDR